MKCQVRVVKSFLRFSAFDGKSPVETLDVLSEQCDYSVEQSVSIKCTLKEGFSNGYQNLVAVTIS